MSRIAIKQHAVAQNGLLPGDMRLKLSQSLHSSAVPQSLRDHVSQQNPLVFHPIAGKGFGQRVVNFARGAHCQSHFATGKEQRLQQTLVRPRIVAQLQKRFHDAAAKNLRIPFFTAPSGDCTQRGGFRRTATGDQLQLLRGQVKTKLRQCMCVGKSLHRTLLIDRNMRERGICFWRSHQKHRRPKRWPICCFQRRPIR